MTNDKLIMEQMLAKRNFEFKPKKFRHDNKNYLKLEEMDSDDVDFLIRFNEKTGALEGFEGKCRFCNNDWEFKGENE